MLLADTEERRNTGLMGVTSLGRYNGMVFRFGGPWRGSFYMYRTRIPLDISFFNNGQFVSGTQMVPCPFDDAAKCPRTGADAEYSDAVEVLAGSGASFGLRSGSSIEITGAPC